MALPGVSIDIQNGALGLIAQTEDNIVGLLLQGVAVSGGIQLLTPTLINSLQDAEDVGLDAAYDTANTVRVYKHIKEFYDEAGTGAPLWIMLVAQAVSMEDMCDKAEANYAVKLLDAAGGKIRVLGVTRSPAGGYSPDTTANHIDLDVVTAIDFAQALAVEYTAKFAPLRVVLEARAYTGTVGSLVNLKSRDDNRVALMLGDTVTGGNGAVGLLLGRVSAIPVQRKVARVKDGSLTVAAAYVGSETIEVAAGDIATIHDKGFITIRTYPRKAGYFFTDDPTATSATDDYNTLSRGRILDKMITIAYDTYSNEILDEIEIDTTSGRIAIDKAKYYQRIIENAIETAMVAEGELSGVTALIDPTQNVLSTNKVVVELRGVPVGYGANFEIKLGFNNPATA